MNVELNHYYVARLDIHYYYLPIIFLAFFFATKKLHENLLWRISQVSQWKWSQRLWIFLSHEQRKLCPNMGFSSGENSTDSRLNNEVLTVTAWFVQLFVTLYSRWNWILN